MFELPKQKGSSHIWKNAHRALALTVLISLFACLKPVTQTVTVWVTVLGTDNMPVEDAQVFSSVGYIKKSTNGWEIEVPTAKLPQDKNITIYATQKSAYLKGKQEIKITNSNPVSVSVQLQRDRSAYVSGTVADTEKKPIADATVSIVGVPGTTTTNSDGHFTMPAKAAEGEEIRLRVSKRGFITRDQYCPAGEMPVYVVLLKE